ncbi:MAG: MaoC family dehydratase [Dehalococcoidia bacterium]
MEAKYFEDFRLGEVFRSPARTITDTHFTLFATITGDAHPIHYDDEYAKRTIFGRRVAHGLLVTSMGALGASPLSPLVEESMVAFLEQSSRFLRPVFVGDALSPELEVVERVPKGDRGLLRLRITIRNQRGETVLEGHHLYLIRRRPAA